jgi:outer membrane protein OmpA-like peptidoglycan-associated protein
MKIKTIIACGALASCLTSGALAQAPAPVLKGSEVNEKALVEALTIEAPMAPGGQTRGFKPAKPGGTDGSAQKPGPGKASLLITFPTDSAELTPETRATLDTLARAVQTDALAGFAFNVEGHADARGDAAHNLQLSVLRAEAVVRYLINEHGILAERLTAVGKGSSEPLNKDRVDAPENRRVTIVTVRS